MIKNKEEALVIAAKAMKKYTENKLNNIIMSNTSWLTAEDDFTFEFELIDHTEAKPAQGGIGPTGWIIPPKHLLSIYIDKSSGHYFIRRFAYSYPWDF